jgi:hypothetical protein
VRRRYQHVCGVPVVVSDCVPEIKGLDIQLWSSLHLLLLLLVHLAVLHDLAVRLCPHHDRLCYRLDLLTLRSATLGLIIFAQLQVGTQRFKILD